MYLRYATNNSLQFDITVPTVCQEIRLVKLNPVQKSFPFSIINWLSIVIQGVQIEVNPGYLHCSRVYVKPVNLSEGHKLSRLLKVESNVFSFRE